MVDDGSVDNTAEIARDHAIGNLISLKVISICNSGVSAARNIGIRAATTEYIAFLDADDEYVENHLAIADEAYRIRPDAIVYWSGIKRIFDSDSDACQAEMSSLPDFGSIALRHSIAKLDGNRHIIDMSIFSDLIRGNFIPTSSSVVKREFDHNLCLFNENLRFAEDRIFFLNLFGKDVGVFTHATTVFVHRDGKNTSATTDRKKSLEMNMKVLYALEHAKVIPSIAQFADRLKIVHDCIEHALRERIFYSSFHGIYTYFNAIKLAYKLIGIRFALNIKLIFTNLMRASMITLKKLKFGQG